ncbi:hypothetical protein NB640_10315 [Oxalobacter vibrioformis]|uniref:Uncharacterized protein n=1 Tax=Oxalobacter vibrioformis TaxID=933080 RepID=A0A9E9LVR9_9BURK|nr:hypothetical protein [Oxalobacter vibrioformis]WAW09617.1 hypothetical protein NB640_10315 [Oxalobacter vibrioformis]
MKQNLLGSPDYNIWEDETPAARALRENLPWHLSTEEKARQPVPPPSPARDTRCPVTPGYR